MTTLTYRGLPCCTCQAEWFPAFEAELVARGLPVPRLMQLIGDAKASAKVHTSGGCADWDSIDVEIAAVARMMGAPATWVRDGSRDSFYDNQHTHSGLRGCVHMASGGLAQIKEVDVGGDGLLGGVADDPRLRDFLNRRTWRQGIEWHRLQDLRRARIAKIEKARARRAKARAVVQSTTRFINRLKALI